MASIQKRTCSDGKDTYRVQVRLKGHPPETATFERLTDARKWIQQTEAAIREGRHFRTSAAKKHTLSEAIDRFSKEVLIHKKNAKNQKVHLKYWQKELGDYRLCDVSTALIVEHRNALLTKINKYGRAIGMATANRYTQTLGHLLNVAMKEWEWLNQNPVTNLKKYKEPRGRVRFCLRKSEPLCLWRVRRAAIPICSL